MALSAKLLREHLGSHVLRLAGRVAPLAPAAVAPAAAASGRSPVATRSRLACPFVISVVSHRPRRHSLNPAGSCFFSRLS
jgi:hypothetical protein